MSLPAQQARRLDGDIGRAAGFLAQVATRLAGTSRLAVITVPAPLAPVETLFAIAEPALLWDPPTGPSAVGIGHTVMLSASGSDRVASIAGQAEAVWQRVEWVPYPGIQSSDGLAPRLYGGFAFAANAASAEPWSDFGDARFVLPTWQYLRDGERAWLTLAVEVRALAGAMSSYLAQLERLFDRLEAGERPTASSERATITSVREMDRSDWRDRIQDIRAAIEARRCRKIVAARCSVVELSRPVDAIAVLAQLDHRYPDCCRFGFRFGPDAVFVGATPERLIQRFGDCIRTQALAGSIATAPAEQSGARPSAASAAANGDHLIAAGNVRAAARALLASRKDRSEQTLVVDAIEEVLRPLCTELHVPAQPEIRALRHVLHLETPISGTLRAPTHVLDLVAALHPTPAVGGVPTGSAMAWIAEREDQPRGWYAAPVGWFDAAGQGEFAVAIRSGLLRGNTAYLYVGAGIVADSDPDSEFAETGLKQRAVLGALEKAR